MRVVAVGNADASALSLAHSMEPDPTVQRVLFTPKYIKWHCMHVLIHLPQSQERPGDPAACCEHFTATRGLHVINTMFALPTVF